MTGRDPDSKTASGPTPDRGPAILLLRREILGHYGLDPERAQVDEIESGHINNSFRVRLDDDDLIVQRINSHVFPDPRGLMANFVLVTEHLARRLRDEGVDQRERRSLRLRETTSGDPWVIDAEGELWRATRFVPRTITHRVAREPRLAREAGRAYGRFQSLLSDLDPGSLVETIPHFHDTPRRYRALEAAIRRDAAGRLSEVEELVEETLRRRPLANRLHDLASQCDLPERIVHNDAKLTNVLLDVESEEAMAVVDLDTVMPGLSLFDFGDMARSMSHRTDEDERDPTRIRVDPALFRALAGGFLETADHLGPAEREHLVDAAQVLVLEQAVRYLSDYLDGDRYFRVSRPSQNLDRARAHLRLLASLQEQERELRG